MLTNPSAWYDFPAYGGGGWADKDGSKREEWIARAAPFFLGAAGVLVMDACVGMQFLYFGEPGPSPVVMVEEVRGKKTRWRRVSGFMRGWYPAAVSVAGTPRPGTPVSRTPSGGDGERQRLLRNTESERAYGAV